MHRVVIQRSRPRRPGEGACHQPAPIEHAGLNPVLDAWSTVSLRPAPAPARRAAHRARGHRRGRARHHRCVAGPAARFLVLVGAAPALALAIERLLLKPELVLATGASRRALAAQQYDARRINAVMLQARGLA